jgi:hypothetical protein
MASEITWSGLRKQSTHRFKLMRERAGRSLLVNWAATLLSLDESVNPNDTLEADDLKTFREAFLDRQTRFQRR